MNLDIQGSELAAIKSLGARIHGVNWIYTEVNTEEVYKGVPLIDDLDSYLTSRGFSRLLTLLTTAGWGDALYIRNDRSRRRHVLIGAMLSVVWRMRVGITKRLKVTIREVRRIVAEIARRSGMSSFR